MFLGPASLRSAGRPGGWLRRALGRAHGLAPSPPSFTLPTGHAGCQFAGLTLVKTRPPHGLGHHVDLDALAAHGVCGSGTPRLIARATGVAEPPLPVSLWPALPVPLALTTVWLDPTLRRQLLGLAGTNATPAA